MIAAANQAGAGQAVTIKSIAEQLGHTDGGVLVLRRYGHLFKGTRRHAALALDEYVRAGEPSAERSATHAKTGATGLEPATSGVTGRYGATGYSRLPTGIADHSRHFFVEPTGCGPVGPAGGRHSLCGMCVVPVVPALTTAATF